MPLQIRLDHLLSIAILRFAPELRLGSPLLSVNHCRMPPLGGDSENLARHAYAAQLSARVRDRLGELRTGGPDAGATDGHDRLHIR